MKKLFALALALCLCAATASAAGQLNVVQENYYSITDYWVSGYVFAKVENSGDAPVSITDGLFEIYDEAGTVIASYEYISAHCAFLRPGEYTYVRANTNVESGVPASYKLTLTPADSSYYVYTRYPVEATYELNVSDGWWTNNYLYVTVTNTTEEPIYDLHVVCALLDEAGNILFVEHDNVYDVAIAPGSSMIFRMEMPSTFTDYFEANGIVPAAIDAFAYTETVD